MMQPPQPLLDDLRNAGLIGCGLRSVVGAPTDVPGVPGAYLLLIGLAQATPLPIRRFAGINLPPGWYVYAGNAHGAGGMRARVARHLRRDKGAHWHVDHLTRAASLAAIGFTDFDECRLVDALHAAPAFDVPVPGFGSSDCRRCESHLHRWQRHGAEWITSLAGM